MPNAIDFTFLIGKKLGNLTVTRYEGYIDGRKKMTCKCDCGISITTRCDLWKKIKTCGPRCTLIVRKKRVFKDLSGVNSPTYIDGRTKEKLHTIWNSMKQRTTNPNVKTFSHYGGRGIKVCDEWFKDYLIFKEWAFANGYAERLSIERINNDGNYEPGNCRWATMKEQCQNRRNSRVLEIGARKQTLRQWSDELGLDHKKIRQRVYRRNNSRQESDLIKLIA